MSNSVMFYGKIVVNAIVTIILPTIVDAGDGLTRDELLDRVRDGEGERGEYHIIKEIDPESWEIEGIEESDLENTDE